MGKLGRQSDIYQYAIDQASIVSITDSDGIITYVNSNFCEISGYKKKELIGKDHKIVYFGYHDKEFTKKVWQTLLKGNSWEGEVCNLNKNGGVYWVKANITPIMNTKGEITEIISICQDISKTKKLESLFEEETKTLNFVLESYEAGMFQYFFNEDRLSYDETFLNLLGTNDHFLSHSKNKFYSLFSEQDALGIKHKIENHISGANDTFSYLCQYRNSESEIRHLMIRGRVIRCDKDNQPEILVGLVTDLTEHHTMENILYRTQEVAKIGSWEVILGEENISWSPSTYDIYGLEPYSTIPTMSNYFEKFVPKEFWDLGREVTEKAIDTKSMQQFDSQIIKSDGSRVWVRHIIYVECIGNEIYKLFGTTQDINDQKILEIDLQRSMKKVDMALETAGFGIGEISHKDKTITADDYLKHLLGLGHIEGHLSYADLKSVIVEEDFEDVKRAYSDAYVNGETIVNQQFRIRGENDIIIFIQSRGIIEYDPNGRPHSILGLFWDISQDKEFERILIETKNKAEEATKMKSSFLASMSHEIRTPMNGVLGMLDLLQDTQLNDEQRKLIETMKVCSDNLLTVVNDVLDFSKIEAGKIEFEQRRFNLLSMTEKITDFFSVLAKDKGIELNLKLDKSLPKYIELDEVRLKQVISNLLSNAVKFTETGSIDIFVYSNHADFNESNLSTTQGVINFIVKDTGIGIEEDKLGKLFSSFTQVDSSTTRKFGGTGLGLAISKSLVEKMGGEIKVLSTPGEGTTFKFNILCPFYKSSEEEGDKSSQDIKYSYRKDLRILVAEDNPINQTLVKAIFKKLDLKVELADNGEITYNLVKEKTFDIVFMDLQMLVMDGLEATKKILNSSEIEFKPMIVALTANVFQEDKNRCFSAGMKDFLPKPLSRKVLLSLLSKYFPDYESKLDHLEERMESPENHYKWINIEQILFEFEDDLDIFEELYLDYKDRYSSMFSELSAAYDNKDLEKIKISAHTLKGVVANFYSDKLTQSAFVIEQAAKEGDLSSFETLFSTFKENNEAVLKEIERLVDEQKKLIEAA